jgi:hypothetical protein
MGGTPSAWLRWFLVLGGLVLGLRLAVLLALPLLPNPFAWGSAAMLGAALTMFLLPLPHEHTLGPGSDVDRPPHSR